MNQNMPPMGPGDAASVNPASNQTSPAAVIALLLSLVSMCTSLFCCAGLLPAGLSIVLGIFAIVQYRGGNANQLSAILGGASVAIGGLAVAFYMAMMLFGFGAGMLDAVNENAPFEVPQQFQQQPQPTY